MSSPINNISPEDYDALLDYMDDEDVANFSEIFDHYNLHYTMYLEDTPRYNETNNILETYLDYALGNGLNEIVNYFIENQGLEITDEVMARTIQLNCIDSYNHLLELGFMPEFQTLKMAIKHSYCDIVESILDLTPELITQVDEETVDGIFSFSIDEESIDTIRILFDFEVEKSLFVKYLDLMDQPDIINLNEDEKDHVIVLADFLRDNIYS